MRAFTSKVSERQSAADVREKRLFNSFMVAQVTGGAPARIAGRFETCRH